MITWNTEMINRLKTGSIKNVLLFGDSMKQLNIPYVVVKPIFSSDRKLWQVFAHYSIGNEDKLEEYVLYELDRLLDDPLAIDGQMVYVKAAGTLSGPYVDEGNNTLAMSRDYFIPLTV